jgi:hypothetical protein
MKYRLDFQEKLGALSGGIRVGNDSAACVQE